MRLASAFKWAGLAVVLFVAAAFAFLVSFDVGRYREEIAVEFHKATGRNLTISGDMDLSISLNPAVVVEQVSVANAGWGSRPAMVTLKRADAEIGLLPLLIGKIRVTRLVLVEPDILLERNADGAPNWRVGRFPSEPTSEPAPAGEDRSGGATPALVFDHVEIHRGRLIYRDAQTGEDMRLDLERVSAKADSFSAPLQFEASGAWNGHHVSASGAVETPADIALGQAARLEFAAEALGFDARAAGTISGPDKHNGIDLQVALRGRDLSPLAAFAGPGLPKLGPVAVDARIEGGTAELRIEDVKAELAGSDLEGRLGLALAEPRPRLSGTLTSSAIDLEELWRAPADSSASASETRPDRVFPDDPLPLEGLKAVDLDLTLSIRKLTGLAIPVDAVEARVSLNNGTLAVEPFGVSIAGSPVDGEFHLNARRAPPSLRLAARADGFDLGRLLAEAGVTDLVEGQANASANLTGTGQSVDALMAGLNGDVRIVSGSGRLRTRAFDAAVAGASVLLGTLFSGRRQWTVVNCAIASVGIEEGRATSRAALIDTEYSTVTASGTADLGSETLDLVVEPRAKSATLTVAVPVHVQGSFTEPRFLPDPGATLRKLGGIAAVALFPPAAIVGLGELGGGDNECLKGAAAREAGTSEQLRAASPEASGRKLKDNLEGIAEGIERGLRGLFRGGND